MILLSTGAIVPIRLGWDVERNPPTRIAARAIAGLGRIGERGEIAVSAPCRWAWSGAAERTVAKVSGAAATTAAPDSDLRLRP